jgi:hypothetical protein
MNGNGQNAQASTELILKFHRLGIDTPSTNKPKNALNSVAGLFIMLLYPYHEKAQGELHPSRRLFRADDVHISGITHTGFEPGINYILT